MKKNSVRIFTPTPKALRFMAQAFVEAESTKGKTLPNPPVGAVLVKNGRIVGRGATRPAGQAHAEIVALEEAGPRRAAGTTLYVTLEPCSHYGRTPPCSLALIKAGIAKVVAACPDPNPKVSGRGFAALRRAGIEVVVLSTKGSGSPWRARAEEFYAGFFHWVRTGRPRIVVKIAQSVDGRINAAPGEETALTGLDARRFAHGLRGQADAILIGAQTLRVDNPDLTPRLTAGSAPQVLVLSRQDVFDWSLQIFSKRRKTKTWIISPKKPQKLPKWVGYLPLKPTKGKGAKPSLGKELLGLFQTQGFHEVLVEGGRGVWTPFLASGLCDVLHIITAPKLLPGGERWGKDLTPAWVKPLEFHRFTPLGSDSLIEFRRRTSTR